MAKEYLYFAKRELMDQDWQTQLAKKIPNIPKGVEVEMIKERVNNLYGNFCLVKFRNYLYYVKMNDLEKVKNEWLL